MYEKYIYIIGIHNAGRDYTYAVTIEESVLKHYRYAEIELMVTGTNHVTVCTPEHYYGSIDEAVLVTLNADGTDITLKRGNYPPPLYNNKKKVGKIL